MAKAAPDWHKIARIDGFEEQVVASLAGVDTDVWRVICRLEAEPGEDDVCEDDGHLRRCPKKRAARHHRRKWMRMTREELGDTIEDLEKRVAALEAKKII